MLHFMTRLLELQSCGTVLIMCLAFYTHNYTRDYIL